MRDYGKRDPSSHRTPQQIHAMDAGYNHEQLHITHRDMNNAARNEYKKRGAVAPNQDIDHIHPLRSGGTNAKNNLRAISKSRNRGWADGKV